MRQVRHICTAYKAKTKKPTLQKRLPCSNASGHTLPGLRQTKQLKNQDEGRIYNIGFAAMLADE